MSVDRHRWVRVLVLPVTLSEAEGSLRGERRTYRKLDTADRETVRSSTVMCAVCKEVLEVPSDLFAVCAGEEVAA